jgi:hypothetical protein
MNTSPVISRLVALGAEISLLENNPQPKGLTDITNLRNKRKALESEFNSVLNDLSSWLNVLRYPRLPETETILWAHSMLNMQNMKYLKVDTTGLDTRSSEVIRVTLLDRSGEVVYDQIMKPSDEGLTNYRVDLTEIPIADLQDAPLASEVWTNVQRNLVGNVLISYPWSFDEEHLTAQNERLGYQPIPLYGQDLQYQIGNALGRYMPPLAEASGRVGHKMLDRTSISRALAERAIMLALADGVSHMQDLRVEASSKPADSSDEFSSSDDFPF